MSTKRNPAVVGDGGARDENDLGRSAVLARNSPTTSQKQYPVIGELSGDNTCSAAGITATGHAPILALCRELIAAGLDPDHALEVYRGAILALRVRSIGEGARLELNAKGTGFAVQAVRRASPARQNRRADTGHLADVPPLLARGGK